MATPTESSHDRTRTVPGTVGDAAEKDAAKSAQTSQEVFTAPLSNEAPRPFEELVEEALAALPETMPTDPTQILVGLDIDGTLLTPQGASPRVVENFQLMLKVGAHPVITTGRTLGSTVPVAELLGATSGQMITSNGAVLAERDPEAELGAHIVSQRTFPVASILDRALEAIPGVTIGIERDGHFLLGEGFPLRGLIENCEYTTLEDLRTRSTPNLILRGRNYDVEEFNALLDDSDLRETHEVFVGWESWANVSALGVTKASGLASYAKDHGIAYEGTVTIGDGANDVPMLEWAAFGVAMGAGGTTVRAASQHVTGAVENDGAAAVMRALLIHCGVVNQ